VELGNRSDLAVHLGGDDFAYISSPARAEVIGARVLENVDSLIPMQYDQASRERGFAVRKDSAGNEVQKPFLSFSIGLVDVLPGLYQHHAQVWDRAKTALAEAKKKGANQLVKLS
jgi:GGDEF domain-containing protein